MNLMMWLFGVSAWRNIVGTLRRSGISWGWYLKISRNVVYFPQYYAVSVSSSIMMEPKDIPKRRIFPTILCRVFHQASWWNRKISRNVVSFPQYYAVSVSSSLMMEPKDIPKRRIFPTILRRVCIIKPEDETERYPETSDLSHKITSCLFHQVWGWNRKISRNVVSFPKYYAVSVSSSLRKKPKDIPKRRIFHTILRLVCFIKSEDGTHRYPETSYLSHNITPCLFHQVSRWNRKISRNVVSFPQY